MAGRAWTDFVFFVSRGCGHSQTWEGRNYRGRVAISPIYVLSLSLSLFLLFPVQIFFFLLSRLRKLTAPSWSWLSLAGEGRVGTEARGMNFCRVANFLPATSVSPGSENWVSDFRGNSSRRSANLYASRHVFARNSLRTNSHSKWIITGIELCTLNGRSRYTSHVWISRIHEFRSRVTSTEKTGAAHPNCNN